MRPDKEKSRTVRKNGCGPYEKEDYKLNKYNMKGGISQ